MSTYTTLQATLRTSPRTWLITGVAGFIGSNLFEALLKLDQHVVGLDNFATGHQRNLDEVQRMVSPEQWARFRFIRARIHTIGGYSAHADQNDLLAFIQGIPQGPKEIRLIHGERDAREAPKSKPGPIQVRSIEVTSPPNALSCRKPTTPNSAVAPNL